MSLSAWERRVLDSIEAGLADSDPKLGSLLAKFDRRTSGEETKIQKLRLRNRTRHSRGKHRYSRRGFRRPSWPALMLWLVVSVGLIAMAMFLNRGAHGPCLGSFGQACAGQPPAHYSRYAEPGRG